MRPTIRSNRNHGFSLIEIMAVIVILAIMAAIIVPRIGRRPVALKKQIMQELNNITKTAQISAIATGKLHRVFFDLKSNIIQAEIGSDKMDSQGQIIFKKLSIPYVKTAMPLEKNTQVNQLAIKGKNLLSHGEGMKNTSAWFYIVPEGMSQEVTVGFYDQEKKQPFSLIINPFTSHFDMAD